MGSTESLYTSMNKHKLVFIKNYLYKQSIMFTVAVSAYTVTDSNGCCQTSFCVIMFSSPRNNTLLCPNIDQLFELSAF